MQKLSLAAVALATAVVLPGCVIVTESDWEDGHAKYQEQSQERENRNMIASLPMQLSLEEAKQRLGTPDFTERWNDQQQYVQVLYYRTHRTKADGMTTRDECTPLVFVDGELTGTGEMALDTVNKSR